ncbi:MAG: signal peptide peptidase SppA, partial [Muribaculaceae bacterium]|nr:signal peptide peptidase SppA [Muribaculaceae bacterium]
DCGSLAAGVATCEELVSYLRGFKESRDKWIYAYADSYSQGAFLVASAADSIFVNPIGAVDIHGAASATPFFKELLDKVGVRMQIIKVGTYKSAVEPFILNEMSEPARKQSQEYIDSIWGYMSSAMAFGRNTTVNAVNVWADSICATWTAERIQRSGIVDATVYRRIMEQRLCELTECSKKEDLSLVSPADYLVAATSPLDMNSLGSHIALLYACGDITDSGNGGIVGETMVPQIVKLAEDDDVKALVMRVNSGGGSAFASEQIWEALEYFKSKGKPFYVSMGDYAASGGYYISCGADRIYADETTLTGSIGVFGMIPEASNLLNDKIGIHFSTVQSGPNAAFPTLFKPLTSQQLAAMQSNVDNTYSLFTQRVADGRDIPVDSVRTIAEGRVWVGSSALRLGLVDETGNIADAISGVSAVCGVDADKVVEYPKEDDNIWATILRESKALDNVSATVGITSAELYSIAAAKYLLEQNPIQARMPFSYIR